MLQTAVQGGQHMTVKQAAWVIILFFVCGPIASPVTAQTKLPPGFVHLRQIDPTILQDIRYATGNNFTGAQVPGYEAAECILLREVAVAVKRVQADLKSRGIGLKVYDCYRPTAAVRSFVAWAEAADPKGLARFYPRTPRSDLVKLGYIASTSNHSRGTTLDLTLIKLPAAETPRVDPGKAYGSCIDVSAEREPDQSIDMGTGFDCFDKLSGADATEITAEQRTARKRLAEAMRKHGFVGYGREWWHFTHAALGRSAKPNDFPVTAAPASEQR
jgi:D-alanyl-D-alanine dipeptidase